GAAIVRAIDARLSIALRRAAAGDFRFDRRVNDVRARAAHIETDSSHIAFGQAFSKLRPRIAAVDAFPDAAAGTTADIGVWTTLTLQRRGVDNVGIPRIEDDVGEAGVRVDALYVLPALAAVRRSEQPA